MLAPISREKPQRCFRVRERNEETDMHRSTPGLNGNMAGEFNKLNDGIRP